MGCLRELERTERSAHRSSEESFRPPSDLRNKYFAMPALWRIWGPPPRVQGERCGVAGLLDSDLREKRECKAVTPIRLRLIVGSEQPRCSGKIRGWRHSTAGRGEHRDASSVLPRFRRRPGTPLTGSWARSVAKQTQKWRETLRGIPV